MDEESALNEQIRKLSKECKYSDAIAPAKRLLKLREQNLEPNYLDIASAKNNLAEVYRILTQFDKALPLYEESIELLEKKCGSNNIAISNVLNNLAALYYDQGYFDKALPRLQRSLKIRKRKFSLNNPLVGNSFNNIGNVHQAIGNIEKAKYFYRIALKIRKDTLDKNHFDIGTTLNNLAEIYRVFGKFEHALRLHRRALKIRQNSQNSNPSCIASSLNNIGELYRLIGNYEKALEYHEASLNFTKSIFRSDHPNAGTAYNNLGVLYAEMNLFSKAQEEYFKSKKIAEENCKPSHPNVCSSQNNIAELYRKIGKYDKALPLYLRSLKIRIKSFSLNNPDVGNSFNNLAELFRQMGKYKKALPLFKQSTKIREKFFKPDHPLIGNSLNNQAVLLLNIGKLKEALPLFEESLEIAKKSLGKDHPRVGDTLFNLATLYQKTGDSSRALDNFKQSITVENKYLSNVFTTVGTERQRLACVQSLSKRFYRFISLINEDFSMKFDELVQAVEWTWKRKGVVLEVQSRINQIIRKRLSIISESNWNRRLKLLEEFSRIAINTPEILKVDYRTYQNRKKILQTRLDEIETSLFQKSKIFAKTITENEATYDSVQKSLPVDSALVEFIKIFDPVTKRTSRYLAFVLSKAGNLNLIDLNQKCDAVELECKLNLVQLRLREELNAIHEKPGDKSISAKREKIQSIRALAIDTHDALKDLYEVLWKPIENLLDKPKNIFISPDGNLNLIPFAALMDDDDKYLIDKYSIAYLTSGKELVSKKIAEYSSANELIAVASPEMGTVDIEGEMVSASEYEVNMLSDLTGGGANNKTILSKNDATKSNLLLTLKSKGVPRILHIVTHGFFKRDQNIALDDTEKSTTNYENPLLHSGLIFPVFNKDDSENASSDERRLTALEMTGTDLYGCQLAVLSSCHSGLGEVENGEGVFGLRRALALSGAKNIMISLWQVTDQRGSHQVISFYENLQNNSPAESLRQAQLDTIQSTEKLGSPASLWAPFIMQGPHAFELLSPSTP